MPGSLTAVAERLDAIEGGQVRLEQQIERVITMLQETLAMATRVEQDNVHLNSDVAILKDDVDIIKKKQERFEQRPARLEAVRIDDGK